MAYITYADYTKQYGDEIDEKTFKSIVNPACDIIDTISRYEINRRGIDSFPSYIQDLIKKACCAQVSYYVLNGLDVSYTGIANQGFTVGKVSVGGTDTTKASAGRMYNAASPSVVMYLEQTGLLNRSVGVCSNPCQNAFFPIK